MGECLRRGGDADVNPSDAPACTVVLNTYNRADVLPRALESVLAQTHPDFEVVVVDDGSTDNTAEVVAEVTDPRVRYVHQENAGLSAARNTGIGQARGRYVVFLDDDDHVVPTWLERLAGPLEQPGVGVACCGATHVHQPENRSETRLPADLGGAWDHVHGLFLTGTFATRRELLLEIGGFEPEMTCSHQTELSLRLVPLCTQRHLAVVPVPELLVIVELRASVYRPMNSSLRLVQGTEFLVNRHWDRLSRSPEVLGDLLAIAGVNSARLGSYRDARRCLFRAIRVNPRLPKHYARLVLALVPPLGNRVWHANENRHVADGLGGGHPLVERRSRAAS